MSKKWRVGSKGDSEKIYAVNLFRHIIDHLKDDFFTVNMSHKELVLSRSCAKIQKDRCLGCGFLTEHWEKLKGDCNVIQSKCLHLFNFVFKKCK